MRVVGGIAKGRKLAQPAIPGARPTSELIRGVIFNVLGSDILEGARIVDLFAGTGSLGIEGLSRGAAWADFVELNPRQCAVIRSNLESTGFCAQGRVHCKGVDRAEDVLEGSYRVALMDPPYKMMDLARILELLDQSRMMEAEGMVVVGHSKRLELGERYGSLFLVRSRRHGDSVVDFFSVEGSR